VILRDFHGTGITVDGMREMGIIDFLTNDD